MLSVHATQAPRGPRVLVVEDQPSGGRAIALRLSGGKPRAAATAGAPRLTIVERAEDAIAVVQQRSFDLFIVDIGLPGGVDPILSTSREC